MNITTAQFRADFPEFSSTELFPNSGIDFWLAFGYRMVNADRFQSNLDIGVELFVAHFITLEARNSLAAGSGGIPGQSSGIISSKSVDKVSISYDTGTGVYDGAGHWNLTNYGTRFYWMIQMFGAGPIQFGQGFAPTGAGFGTAWPGPDTTPGFSNF
jgi:hypothetical protein